MINLTDPAQRHIHAIAVRDAIVRDNASDLAAGAADSARQRARLLRAMLATTDFTGSPAQAALDDPVGRRVGRVAFNPAIRAMWIDNVWTGGGPEPHRLPETIDQLCAFIRQQCRLKPGLRDDVDFDSQIDALLGFRLVEHARTSDQLRQGGAAARLFVAASMLSAACAGFDKAQSRPKEARRQVQTVDAAAMAVQAALIGTARIAAEIFADKRDDLPRVGRVALYLTSQVERFCRFAGLGKMLRAIATARDSAHAVLRFLACGTVQDIPLEADRDPALLSHRLDARCERLDTCIRTMIEEVEAIDSHALYVLLLAQRLDVALARHPWLKAPHPVFRVTYAYLGGHALFAELERLGAIIAAMDERRQLIDATVLTAASIRPTLKFPQATRSAIEAQSAEGRYLDLGVYHRAVATTFMSGRKRWLLGTVQAYPHHAYAIGSRFCDLAIAAADSSTHDFIQRTEFDKPTHRGHRSHDLVLFYGLEIDEVAILGLRQILARTCPIAGSEARRVAFGKTVHAILSQCAPSIAQRLSMTSSLRAPNATCKGIANAATELARRFDDRDHDRPGGVFFDYALWFDRDRDLAFWDRLQRDAKLHATFLPLGPMVEPEPLPGMRGRRVTRHGDPVSRWSAIMAEAKQAFDTYQPLYLKSRPSRLTARIMARMSQGYSVLASDPQFREIFRTR